MQVLVSSSLLTLVVLRRKGDCQNVQSNTLVSWSSPMSCIQEVPADETSAVQDSFA